MRLSPSRVIVAPKSRIAWAVISTYGRETSSPSMSMVSPSRMCGAPIIRPLMYWELRLPGTRTLPPVRVPPWTRSGTQPATPSASTRTPSELSASISGEMGRSRMRATPSSS